jgi:hypothetical protein
MSIISRLEWLLALAFAARVIVVTLARVVAFVESARGIFMEFVRACRLA